VSELVVDLTDAASVELAWQVLKLVRVDHTIAVTDRSQPELPPWEASTEQGAGSAESNATASEPDPWAVSAQNHETPAETTTEPSSATDDDNPWS
jgi:hypothetical protein